MSDDELLLFRELAALGAGDFAHRNGTLEKHLIAVHGLLKQWGAPVPLCRAGLYHAAYGTAGFTQAMVSLDRRQEIAKLIGPGAEQIVYTYCACDRMLVWPQIGRSDTVEFSDRFTGMKYDIAGEELRSFCELSCANELELAISDEGFAHGVGRQIGGFFRRWSGYLSVPAKNAVEKTFP